MAGDRQGADESNLTREEGEGEPTATAPAKTGDARACMPCRGTGKVISNLGGTRSEVRCPWCQGSGVRQAGVDAQAGWREREGADREPADGAAGESS
jgi:hypothetical protein